MKDLFQEFKTPIITVLIVFVAVFLYTKLAGPFPFSINSVNTNKTDLFTSEGQGKETAIPDQATVFLGVTTQASTVSDAQNKANQTATKIISAIKNQGISEKDIKTTNYSVNPDYGSGTVEPMMMPIRGGGNNITGYTVSQNLEVKVKPIDKVNKVIDSATLSGANLVGGINFTFSDQLQQTLENKARKEAVNNAKEKAKNLADAAGVHLGRIVNVVESSNGFPRPLMMGTTEVKTDQSQPTNVTPGENSVTVTVTIYYETY